MATREALKQAISDLERLATVEMAVYAPTVSVLARLYTTYAQATLEAHGISIDLPSVCGDHLVHQKRHTFRPNPTRH